MSEVGRFVLGTAQLGMKYGINNQLGKPEKSEAQKIIELAKMNGIKFIDTADAYGDSSETLGHIGVENFKITSKFLLNSSAEKFNAKLESSLKSLNVSSLWGYFFHNFGQYEKFEDWNEIQEAKFKKKITNLGVSVYHNSEFEKAINDPRVDIIQFPFNVFDSGSAKRDLIKNAFSKNKILHARSLFLQGFLLMNPVNIPVPLKELYEPLQQLVSIASEANLTVSQLCISYALSYTDIEGLVLGLETAEQLQQNISLFSHKRLDESVMNEIKKIKIENLNLLNPGNWNIK